MSEGTAPEPRDAKFSELPATQANGVTPAPGPAGNGQPVAGEAASAGGAASGSDPTGPEPTAQHDRLALPVADEEPPRLPFPVVGIGGSAGGLQAFSDFFEVMPPDSGIAFVVVQHLPPDRESLLAELLGKRTRMPVAEVENGMLVEPNHVYVIRPGRVLRIVDGVLRLQEPLSSSRVANRPVDDFFKSLAEEQRERAIAIIMSGMGSNGTAGCQAIKAVGGLCIAQSPDSAQFPSMPRRLIDQGYADFVLSPREMPDALLLYATHPYARGERSNPEDVVRRNNEALMEVLAILRTRVKQDFTAYKRPTIFRRIQRRLGLSQLTDLGAYARLLRQNPSEVQALADDLLIHVTGFFRDEDAWVALNDKVIKPLVASREDDGSIRCWVTACSSGEEAYSLAILLAEAAEQFSKTLDIKIFATDMAERSLAHARAGVYPGGIETEISPERLERFFDKDDGVYRIKRDVREMVIFAPQNVLQDPPFSKLDIASCRNLLIYLEPEVQRRILTMLHFGLREGGALFLGTSETIGEAQELFEPVDKRWRIYRRIGAPRYSTLNFPTPRLGGSTGTGYVPMRPAARTTVAQISERVLLDRYTPAAVVVDRDHRIVYYHGGTDPYLSQPSGEPTRDVLSLARDKVRSALRTALYNAMQSNAAARTRDGMIDTDDGPRRVYVTAAPLDDKLTPGMYLISFETEQERNLQAEPHAEVDDAGWLRDELARTRDELQSTIEELQSSNEELKAANEEVTSINEELQSTNEELETSKEELQSLNEELTTLNAQLQSKMEEHEAASNDLQSLLSSTDIGVIFLDPRMRIRRYTPSIRDLMELIPSDIGRPLSDLNRKFDDPHLVDDCRAVLEKLSPVEREVRSTSGAVYARRVLPYRTADNRIDGIVITFIDVSTRTAAEAELEAAKAYAESIIETLHEPLLVLKPDLTVATANHAFYAHFKVNPASTIGRKVYDLGNAQWDIPELRALLEDILPKKRVFNDYQVSHKFETLGQRAMLLNARQLDQQRLILLGLRDITDQHRIEQDLRRSQERLKRLMNVEGVGVLIFEIASGALVDCNDGFLQMSGYSREHVRSGALTWRTMTPPEHMANSEREIRKLEETGRIGPYEKQYIRRDGSRAWMLFAGASLGDGTAAEFCIDVGDRRHYEEAGRQNAERLRLVLEGARDFAIIMLDPDNRITMWSGGAERLFGWKTEEAVGQLGTIIFTEEDQASGAAAAELLKARRDGKANDERWHVRQNGSRFWASGVMHALREPGRPMLLGYVKVLRDETGRREAEEALREAKNAAELANRLKDEFLATVSHELRTPVSSILLWSNILMSGNASKEQIDEALRAIKHGAESQRELIDDLMDSSRISSGKLRMELRRTNLVELVKSSIETVLPTATAKGVKLIGNLSDDIGTVMADPDRLRQVIWNLLTNAVKFTPAEGRVDIVLLRRGGKVEIRVVDTGSGIAPDFLPHIFEAFRQGDGSTTRLHGGLGLGLAITKQLVELHGGTVDAQSEGLGKGSTFIVKLPLSRVAETLISSRRRPLRGAAAPAAEPAVDLSGVRVVLVEDDADTRTALTLLLRGAGMDVRAFDAVPPALVAIDEQPPEVILSDIGLPGEDGFSFVRRVREKEAATGAAAIPAIALTAFSRDQDRQQAASAGFHAYLDKPVQPEQLLAAIREVVRKK